MKKITNALLNSSLGKRLAKDNASARLTSRIVLASAVTKDAVGCLFYTYQSLNNKRIPEDQRKFVGALDFANGILNVGVQVLMAFGVEDAIMRLFDKKLAPKYFSEMVFIVPFSYMSSMTCPSPVESFPEPQPTNSNNAARINDPDNKTIFLLSYLTPYKKAKRRCCL